MPELGEYEGYFFDLDGTIYLGERLLPGVAGSLSALRRRDKQVMFLSNTTVRTRQECAERLRRLGLEARTEELVTAGYAAAQFLREQGSRPLVYVVGEAALHQELAWQGVPETEVPEAATHVLVGMDTRFDYGKLHRAMKAVRGGALLVAANPDPNCPVDGDLLPDTWSMVKAIEAASGSEVWAVIGKPSRYYGAKVLELCGLPAGCCLMVGDRLETDVEFGAANGLRTALVLTGAATRQDLARSGLRPDYVWSSMEELQVGLSAFERP